MATTANLQQPGNPIEGQQELLHSCLHTSRSLVDLCLEDTIYLHHCSNTHLCHQTLVKYQHTLCPQNPQRKTVCIVTLTYSSMYSYTATLSSAHRHSRLGWHPSEWVRLSMGIMYNYTSIQFRQAKGTITQ